MTEQNSSKSHDAKWSEEALQDLYRQYLSFVLGLRPERDCDKTYPEFVHWWTHLESGKRAACERDFQKGAAVVIRDSITRLTARDHRLGNTADCV